MKLRRNTQSLRAAFCYVHKGVITVKKDTIGEWTKENAEVNIRRWLIKQGLWAPGAELVNSAEQIDDESSSSNMGEEVLAVEQPTRDMVHQDLRKETDSVGSNQETSYTQS
ncbi:MAG: hypothetical protein GFH27_549293n124 [Chloroflexi bacterium AL-W]|nr:hypothetical protein [Chloroflexi bacterium AL-N1]NOK67761.1 hypothetical protein [Chloroflexi bacterium AL-N10]NOK75469.1 hypothetical protein [Chloroflexi bacterium AL-N5]NOK82257.1 hypothetical protein [Chloroflexi bacterium AL-W]NOK90102.1 hypothetical protein [Chloroflexi bacterium AL-N15]